MVLYLEFYLSYSRMNLQSGGEFVTCSGIQIITFALAPDLSVEKISNLFLKDDSQKAINLKSSVLQITQLFSCILCMWNIIIENLNSNIFDTVCFFSA